LWRNLRFNSHELKCRLIAGDLLIFFCYRYLFSCIYKAIYTHCFIFFDTCVFNFERNFLLKTHCIELRFYVGLKKWTLDWPRLFVNIYLLSSFFSLFLTPCPLSVILEEPKMTVDSDKLVSWFVQTPPSKNRPFYNWLICFVIIENDVLYLGGVCTPVYPSLQKIKPCLCWPLETCG